MQIDYAHYLGLVAKLEQGRTESGLSFICIIKNAQKGAFYFSTLVEFYFFSEKSASRAPSSPGLFSAPASDDAFAAS